MARRRVEWTEHEQDELFTGTIDHLKLDPRQKLIDAVILAQLKLPETRRRKLAGPSQLPGPLRNRFITAGALPRDWERAKRGGTPKPDERDERIKSLENEVSSLTEALRTSNLRVRELEARPSLKEEAQNFIAEALALALQKSRAVPGLGLTPMPAPDIRPPKPRHDGEMRPGPTDRPPVIMLLGLDHEQIKPYERRYNGKAYFRYWSDGKLNTLSEQLKRCDFTIIKNDPPVANVVFDAVKSVTQNFQRVMPAMIDEQITRYLSQRGAA